MSEGDVPSLNGQRLRSVAFRSAPSAVLKSCAWCVNLQGHAQRPCSAKPKRRPCSQCRVTAPSLQYRVTAPSLQCRATAPSLQRETTAPSWKRGARISYNMQGGRCTLSDRKALRGRRYVCPGGDATAQQPISSVVVRPGQNRRTAEPQHPGARFAALS